MRPQRASAPGSAPSTGPGRRVPFSMPIDSQPLLQSVWTCEPIRRSASLIRTDHSTSDETAIHFPSTGTADRVAGCAESGAAGSLWATCRTRPRSPPSAGIRTCGSSTSARVRRGSSSRSRSSRSCASWPLCRTSCRARIGSASWKRRPERPAREAAAAPQAGHQSCRTSQKIPEGGDRRAPGGKAHLPAGNSGWLPCRLPATPRSSLPPCSSTLRRRPRPIPPKPQNFWISWLRSKTEAKLSHVRNSKPSLNVSTESVILAGRVVESGGLWNSRARVLPERDVRTSAARRPRLKAQLAGHSVSLTCDCKVEHQPRRACPGLI